MTPAGWRFKKRAAFELWESGVETHTRTSPAPKTVDS